MLLVFGSHLRCKSTDVEFGGFCIGGLVCTRLYVQLVCFKNLQPDWFRCVWKGELEMGLVQLPFPFSFCACYLKHRGLPYGPLDLHLDLASFFCNAARLLLLVLVPFLPVGFCCVLGAAWLLCGVCGPCCPCPQVAPIQAGSVRSSVDGHEESFLAYPDFKTPRLLHANSNEVGRGIANEMATNLHCLLPVATAINSKTNASANLLALVIVRKIIVPIRIKCISNMDMLVHTSKTKLQRTDLHSKYRTRLRI